MKRPSILLINRVYPPSRGATGRMAQDLARALVETGWNVHILSAGEKKNLITDQHITTQTVKGAKKPKSGLGLAVNLWRLLWAGLRVPKHDIVITMTDPPLLVFIGNMIARVKKSAHVHWAQDVYPDLFRALKVRLPNFILNFLMKRSRRALNKCDQVVAIGRCMAKHLVSTGVQADKITMIANWTDFEVIAPTKDVKHNLLNVDPEKISRKPEEMRRHDNPKFRVLYAGNIGRAHPMRCVIEAAALLVENDEIEFTFVGDHHVHSILSRERGRRHLENIKFMPYQPIEKLRDVMESGDLHLVTMRPEARGLLVPCKFYSGIAVGRPTIFVGPKKSEVGQVITDYDAGKIVPVNDPKALADAIYAYRMDGEAWFQAQEGALRAAQAYHPNNSLHKWIELLEKTRVKS